eukprot:354715-Chlamydomonas_euryale.AAC.4
MLQAHVWLTNACVHTCTYTHIRACQPQEATLITFREWRLACVGVVEGVVGGVMGGVVDVCVVFVGRAFVATRGG